MFSMSALVWDNPQISQSKLHPGRVLYALPRSTHYGGEERVRPLSTDALDAGQQRSVPHCDTLQYCCTPRVIVCRQRLSGIVRKHPNPNFIQAVCCTSSLDPRTMAVRKEYRAAINRCTGRRTTHARFLDDRLPYGCWRELCVRKRRRGTNMRTNFW